MRNKNLFFLALIFAALTVRANNAPIIPAPASIPSNPAGMLCNQPAPFLFHISEVGTTWVRYTWAGNAAFKHRIRTYRASDNFLLSTVTVPIATATAVVNNLPSGTEVYGVINAICADDSNSSEQATSARGNTLILELLVQGFTAPNGGRDCWHTGSGTCSFSSDLNVYSYFKIYPTGNSSDYREFALKRKDGIVYSAYIDMPNGDDTSPFDFKCSGGVEPNLGPNGNSCEGPQLLEIIGSAGLIGTFTAEYNIDVEASTFIYTQETGGYTIENILPEGRGKGLAADPSKGFIRERDENPSRSNRPATAQPNPFSETLEVYLSASAETIQLQLYNLAGQKVLDQQFTGSQDQYALNTAALSPGFYLLRIEVDGEVQTLKVVK